MKYFDENNQIIKAQRGLEFLRPKQELVIDNTGGLGAAQHYNLSMERRQEAEKTKAETEAKTKVQKMQDAQRKQPQLKATTATEQEAARRRTKQHEIQQKLDENAANIGYTLGSVGRQNYNSLMGNYTAGANAFALFGAPLLTTAFYGGKDLSEGNYGWALASFTPFARVRGAVRGAVSGYKAAAKEATEVATKKAAEASTKATAKESAAAMENEILADIRYRGSARSKRPKVYDREGQRIKPGEEIPKGATVLNRRTGKQEPLEGKVFRTPQGWGRSSYIYADGTPVEWWKNLGFYKKAGAWVGGTSTLIGLPNAGTLAKGVAEGTTTGNGAIAGIVKAFQEKFKSKSEADSTQRVQDSISDAKQKHKQDSIDLDKRLQAENDSIMKLVAEQARRAQLRQ